MLYNEEIKINYSNNSTNEIKFCEKCNSTVFYTIIIAYEDVHISEKEIRCHNCNNIVNYWSYGYYENIKSDKYLKKEKEILRIKKMKQFI